MTNARILSLMSTAIDALSPPNNQEETDALEALKQAQKLLEANASASTAPINPRTALLKCVTALHPLASLQMRDAAADMAQEALRGDPYSTASLETAACLWEAVLTAESQTDSKVWTDEVVGVATAIKAAREAMGSIALRLTVLGWVETVDTAWRAVDTANGEYPKGGVYHMAFDWDFVPDWLTANVDWSNPHAPTIRAARVVVDGKPWDGCDDATRHYLTAQGFEPEMAGGCCFRAVCNLPNGAGIIATGGDGCDMPSAVSWAIGVYPPCSDDDAPEAVQMFYSDPATLTLPQAIAGALAMAHLFQPLPTPPALPRFAMSLTILHTLHVEAPNELRARQAATRFIDETFANESTADGWNSAQTDRCRIVGQVGPDIERLSADDVNAL